MQHITALQYQIVERMAIRKLHPNPPVLHESLG